MRFLGGWRSEGGGKDSGQNPVDAYIHASANCKCCKQHRTGCQADRGRPDERGGRVMNLDAKPEAITFDTARARRRESVKFRGQNAIGSSDEPIRHKFPFTSSGLFSTE
jgi:hypothetical protein